jgi:hypothetical protein
VWVASSGAKQDLRTLEIISSSRHYYNCTTTNCTNAWAELGVGSYILQLHHHNCTTTQAASTTSKHHRTHNPRPSSESAWFMLLGIRRRKFFYMLNG